MGRPGSWNSLLDPLHKEGCDGTEYTACRPVVVEDERKDHYEWIRVVYMAWCGQCGAADWEEV